LRGLARISHRLRRKLPNRKRLIPSAESLGRAGPFLKINLPTDLAITGKNDRFPNTIGALKIFRDTNLAQKTTSYLVKIKQFFVLEAPHNLKVIGSNPVGRGPDVIRRWLYRDENRVAGHDRGAAQLAHPAAIRR
jgi:hypothetical protein